MKFDTHICKYSAKEKTEQHSKKLFTAHSPSKLIIVVHVDGDDGQETPQRVQKFLTPSILESVSLSHLAPQNWSSTYTTAK